MVIVVEPEATLIWVTPNPEQVIEAAGRTAYKSEDKITKESAADFVRKIRKLGHWSVIEHACASFRLVMDRGQSHEFVRHRLLSLTQESTRYCSYKKNKFGSQISVVEPFFSTKEAYLTWKASVEHIETFYMTLLDQGEKSQMGRSILPISLKTELVATANFREWSHILNLRLSKAAHPQIRFLIAKVGRLLIREAPAVFEEFLNSIEEAERLQRKPWENK